MNQPLRRSPWRIARKWAAVLLGTFLLVCGIMWLIENKLVYHPTPAGVYWEPPPDPGIQDAWLDTPSGRIHAWWLPDAEKTSAVLLCPGNAGNLSGRGQTLLRLRERLGRSAMVFDYPGYGKSEGKPSEAGCYEAGEAAIRWLRDSAGISPGQVVLYGESLGGGVAAELASRYRVRALVLLKSFTSLPATAKRHYSWLPVNWLMSNRFDTRSKLPTLECPIFILGATADRVVPFEQSQANFEVAREPKAFFTDEGSDHNDPLPEAFWDRLRSFLDRTE